jgi:ribosomal protein S19E (S16A)
MDLSRLETDENGEQVLGNTGQLVLPPDGFLRSFSAMENLVQQLKDAGLVESKDNKRKYSPKD